MSDAEVSKLREFMYSAAVSTHISKAKVFEQRTVVSDQIEVEMF